MKFIRTIFATLIAASLWCASATPAANAQFRRDLAPPVQALFLGDSYSVGVGGTPWSEGFVDKVAKYYGWKASNYSARAVGYLKGDTPGSFPNISHCLSPQGCRYLEQQFDQAIVDGLNPDIVFVSGGRNDDPGATFEPAVRSLVAKIQTVTPHAKIYVTSPVTYGKAFASMTLKIKIVRQVCKEAGVTFIDLGWPLPFHKNLLFRDQIHPNNNGYSVLANIIEKQIDSSDGARLEF